MAMPAAAAVVLSHNRACDSASPAVPAGWALFERSVALGHLANTAAAAVSKTSNDRDVRVSLRRLIAPPACCCVQLCTDDKVSTQPTVAAADGDLLLIHMVVAVEGIFKRRYPHNFFVYKADPESPSLQSVPPPPCDWKFQAEGTGISRKGKEFVLANLKTNNVVVDATTKREIEVAFVWLYRSATEQWEKKQLDMPYAEEEEFVDEFWSTDAVFSFLGFICWVDYYHGIIYCDVFSPDPELGFLRFPVDQMRRSGFDVPNVYRTFSICRGHLKFVDITNGRFGSTERSYDDADFRSDDEGTYENDNHSYEGCTIKTWTLRMPEFKWEENAALQLGDLWSLPSYQDSPLSHDVPTFPIVDMQEDNILHFILKKGPGFLDKAWMVTVDMKNKSLGQYALYENPIKAEDSRGVDYSNVFLDIPLVSTQLCH